MDQEQVEGKASLSGPEALFRAQFPFLFDPNLSDDVKKHLISTTIDQESARETKALEARKWRSGTPLAIALTGLITLAGNFIFDYLRAESATKNTVTLTQLQAELNGAADKASRENESRLASLKSDLEQRAADLASKRSITFEEKQFQFKIVERELNSQHSETERAKVLLFLVRSGVLNTLNEKNLTEMATATLAASAGTLSRQSGASVSVGVPRIPNSDISPAEAPLRSPGSVALEIMKRFEGFVALPYNDQAGYCSIGYGHIVSLNRCEDTDLGLFAKGVSEEEAGRLLENDTELARRAIQELVTAKLTDDQFGALTSLVSNIGIQNFSKSTLLKSLNQGQYDLVPRQMLRWKSAAGRTLPLLAERRSCEAALFAGAPPVNDDGNLDPTKCLAYRDPDPPSDAEPPGDSAILPQ